MRRILALSFALLVWCSPAWATGSLALEFSRAGAGGGVSSAAQFALVSTVGQAEAAPHASGGAFGLDTGFLAATLPFTPPTPPTNQPPIGPITQTIRVGAGDPAFALLHATNRQGTSTDLSFTLGNFGPTNASLNSTRGIFFWPTELKDAGTTNYFEIRIADQSGPLLISTQWLSVVVDHKLTLNLGSVALVMGTDGQLGLEITSSARVTNLFVWFAPGAALTNLTFTSTAPEVAQASIQANGQGLWSLSFQTHPGQYLQGTRMIGWLGFTVPPGANSAFANLSTQGLWAWSDNGGLVARTVAYGTQVAVVGQEPLLAMDSTPAGPRLILHSPLGSTVRLQYRPTLDFFAGWQDWQQVTATNLTMTFDHLQGLPSLFFRAVRVN